MAQGVCSCKAVSNAAAGGQDWTLFPYQTWSLESLGHGKRLHTSEQWNRRARETTQKASKSCPGVSSFLQVLLPSVSRLLSDLRRTSRHPHTWGPVCFWMPSKTGTSLQPASAHDSRGSTSYQGLPTAAKSALCQQGPSMPAGRRAALATVQSQGNRGPRQGKPAWKGLEGAELGSLLAPRTISPTFQANLPQEPRRILLLCNLRPFG